MTGGISDVQSEGDELMVIIMDDERRDRSFGPIVQAVVEQTITRTPERPSTIRPPDPPPFAEPLSLYHRVKLESILLDLDCARERLRKLLST